MPVHWYYNTMDLDRDYPSLVPYEKPRNPHSGSILWRSRYSPKNPQADILHDQARFWGQRGIHYHQFLEAGENTVNFLLAAELHRFIVETGEYDETAWLNRYVSLMRQEGWHRDTYLEEYHRGFFENLAEGKELSQCGIDDRHIGGLTPVAALLAALDAVGKINNRAELLERVVSHVTLTHRNSSVAEACRALGQMILAVADGTGLRDAIAANATGWIGARKLEKLAKREDRDIVGRSYSTACYLPDSFTASLCLAWKYHDDFSGGIVANARCGGDNCHRGAVVGALLGSNNSIEPHWIDGLQSMERFDLAAAF